MLLEVLGFILIGAAMLVAFFSDITTQWPYCLGAILVGTLLIVVDRKTQ